MIGWDLLNSADGEDLIKEIFLNHARYIPMQCTGLKDRNGRLIYEGDVVKSCRGEIGVVEWDQKACAYFAVNKSDGWDFSANDSHPCEIIGTIHENPELLEEQK